MAAATAQRRMDWQRAVDGLCSTMSNEPSKPSKLVSSESLFLMLKRAFKIKTILKVDFA